MKKSKILFINPPNTPSVAIDTSTDFTVPNGVTNGLEHTDWANFPHLGILSLASYIDKYTEFESIYFDAVVCPIDIIENYITANEESIFAVCVSLLTANYSIGIELLQTVKETNPAIYTIVGNDHFSALKKPVMEAQFDCIDYGLVGNEVYSSLKNLLLNLKMKKAELYASNVPGLVFKTIGNLIEIPQQPEPINSFVDYTLIDKNYAHSVHYSTNFESRLGKRLFELFGRKISKGVPIELARGCIKFNGNDACSFCSIQYGGMWKNAIASHEEAWKIIENAWRSGYDYLYVTADELPMTFAGLIRKMSLNQPEWWTSLNENERPILVGYARADGMIRKNIVTSLQKIGFKILYIGIDAGSIKSLEALNKPVNSGSAIVSARKMYEANHLAFENARNANIAVKAGFVLGHIGMDSKLLQENVESFCALITKSKGSIVSVDVELLSPEPGSLDYEYLVNPALAELRAKELNLDIAQRPLRNEIARKYKNKEIFDREEAIADYVVAFMPSLDAIEISWARDTIRDKCKEIGIVVGDAL